MMVQPPPLPEPEDWRRELLSHIRQFSVLDSLVGGTGTLAGIIAGLAGALKLLRSLFPYGSDPDIDVPLGFTLVSAGCALVLLAQGYLCLRRIERYIRANR